LLQALHKLSEPTAPAEKDALGGDEDEADAAMASACMISSTPANKCVCVRLRICQYLALSQELRRVGTSLSLVSDVARGGRISSRDYSELMRRT